MKQPKAAGTSLQALDPLVQKVTALEAQALRGEAMPVVQMATELATTLVLVARRVMGAVLSQAALAQPTKVRCPCGGTAVSQGFEDTFFIGRYGKVDLSRRRVTCDSCGRSWLPFDEAWAVPSGAYTDDVREATERLSCRLGFDEAVQELQHLWGVSPDGTTAKLWVGQDGRRAEQAVKQEATEHWQHYQTETFAVAQGEHRAIERTDGFGVVEVDGVMSLCWKPGQEPRRQADELATQQPQEQHSAVAPSSETSQRAAHHQAPSTLSEVAGSPMGPTGRSPRVRGREICMGIAYRSEHAAQESPGRGTLLHKRYVATLNDRDSFWTKLHAAAALQGVLGAKTVVRVSDGGAYFVDRSAELFRDQPLVGILDIQHAKQHVWEAGQDVVASQKKTWVQPYIQAICDGRVGNAVIDLRAERKRRKGRRQRKAIDSLAGYLNRHRELMNYPSYRAQGYPIASAAIESTNKRLVSRRCKQGGMIWSESGLEAIVALRLAFYNPGTWQRLWPHTAAAASSAA